VTTLVFVAMPFRASSLASAVTLWKAMLGFQTGDPGTSTVGWAWVVVLCAIALALPNTVEIFTGRADMTYATPPERKPTVRWAVFSGLAFGMSLAAILGGQPIAFLYFRF